MKKRTLFVMIGMVMGSWGCSFSAGTVSTATPLQVDEVGTVVAATLQAFTPAPTESFSTQAVTSPAATLPAATPESGTPISSDGVSFLVPGGLASGANAEKITAVESNSTAPWDIAPTHLRFTLKEYTLQGRFHEPRIYVYPAGAYAASNPHAADQIDRIRRILSGAALLEETLPTVPFFNAAQLFAAQVRILPFQNGGGVRSLTQYAQYAAPVNNHELFYHFQGLTSDGNYYVIAILPVTAPILAEDERPEAAVPEGGVTIPADVGPNDVYYFSVTESLNSLALDAFTPSLSALDALVQSLVITNP